MYYGRYPDYYYSDFDSFSEVAPFLFGFLAVFLIIALIICAAVYVIQAIGLYNMAKRRGMERAFLAWIPVANSYLLGEVADHIQYYKGKKTNYAVILICLAGGSLLVGMLSAIAPFIALLSLPASIALLVFTHIACYEIYKDYSPKNATVFLVLGILFSIYWVFIFALRNKQPITLGGYDPAAPYGQPPYPPQMPQGQPPYGGQQPPQQSWQHPYSPQQTPPQGGWQPPAGQGAPQPPYDNRPQDGNGPGENGQ